MGRPKLRVGTNGSIRAYGSGTNWTARTLFRDSDGQTREVKRGGTSKSGATQNLQAALRDRQRAAVGDLSADSSFADAGALWLAEVKRKDRGTTYDRYNNRLHGRLIPALGALCLREVTTGRCDRYLQDLLEEGLRPATVRGYRASLSGIMAYAVRMGAIPRNPVNDVADIRGRGKQSRALTPPERVELLAKLDADPVAVDNDLPALIRYMLGSGVRIGEALGLRWLRVDLELGVVIHGETLVRETGKGLLLHDAKTAAGVRIIKVPEFVRGMLELRWPGPGFEGNPVFPNAVGGWRDPIATARAIRTWRTKAGFDWFTSHTCRHTAIMIADQAGVSPREYAGHVGHTDMGFTQRTYLDMKQQSGAVAEALEQAYRGGRS